MFKNYFLTALRNLQKNKLFALINIGGLALGLMVFVFANLFANYESTHDVFFENSERIYSIKSNINPAAELGIVSINSTYTALGPLIKQDLPEIEKVARIGWTELIINRDDVKFYQSVHMVEPEFFDIFLFDYIEGNAAQAMRDPNSVVLTETGAFKYFGRTNVLGETLTVNNDRDLRVTAVIKDLPPNSHLASNMFDDERLEVILNQEVSYDILGTDPAGDWTNLSTSLRTYVLLPEGISPESLKGRLNEILVRNAPEGADNTISSIDFRRLQDMNLLAWQAIGIPVIFIMRFLGLLVLGIACINFINLATAQALGRAREIGIRKTMGASRTRLAIQFLVESVVLSFLALIIAVAVIEYALPAFNTATDKAITFSYFSDPMMAAFLLVTVFAVGIFSGSFPAFLLARLDASQALNGAMALGRWSVFFRKFLVISQNAFSVFLIISVMVTYMQTKNIQDQDNGFNAENTLTVLRVNRDGVNENYETLQSELARVPGVNAVTASSQYPYEQSNNAGSFSLIRGDEAANLTLNRISVDYNFLETFEIPLLAGRQLSSNFAEDMISVNEVEGEARTANVIISALAAKSFGWETPGDALDQTIYRNSRSGVNYAYVVVGVAEDANFMGFHNKLKPFIYRVEQSSFSAISVKYDAAQLAQVEAGIEAAWNRVLPEFPIIQSSLDAAFDDIFQIFSGITNALLVFSLMALLIATIGLFGLSAFMAERRIKEVGIRKTFGASTGKIVKLLTFQFSKPVLWALLIAIPLAFISQYFLLDFFADPISNDASFYLIFIFGGLFTVVLSWVTVGANAYRAANSNPINSLHYE